MKETAEIVVCLGKGGQAELAESIARKVGAQVSEQIGEDLTIYVDKDGVSLRGYGLIYRGDFEEDMLRRLTEGRLQHEMLSKVVKTTDEHPKAIDATAGMGEDSIIIAACGYDVTLCEQNPVVAALLKDAIRRAKKHPVLGPIVSRMQVYEGNSIDYMSNLQDEVDLIYLDPMFPARQKTGLINKKLQLIQKLEHPCTAEEELLNAALKAKPKKIIIKRPLKGPNLAGREPGYSVKGKAIRYDCIKC